MRGCSLYPVFRATNRKNLLNIRTSTSTPATLLRGQQRAITKLISSPDISEDISSWKESLRRWVATQVMPHVNQWEGDGQLPRSLYKEASELGILGVGFPTKLGGTGGESRDLRMMLALCEELCRAGSGGLIAGLLTHNISLPPIMALGNEEQIQRVVPAVLSGEKVAALAISEPSGGSDVANIQTTARREGDSYILNGTKTFITSGMQADYYTVAARTGGHGPEGISLFIVERDAPGFHRSRLEKTGWWCSDTATLTFDECVVSVDGLLGNENQGFKGIMYNFNTERIFLAAQSIYFSHELVKAAMDWARERQTFGARLVDHQAIRHKLVDMASQLAAADALLNSVVDRYRSGEDCVAHIAMLKNVATDCMHACADGAVQTLGGAGYIQGHLVERLYREVKVMQIGGGATEIMKDLAAKQMGLLDRKS